MCRAMCYAVCAQVQKPAAVVRAEHVGDGEAGAGGAQDYAGGSSPFMRDEEVVSTIMSYQLAVTRCVRLH